MGAVTTVVKSLTTVGPRRTFQLVRARLGFGVPSGGAIQVPRRMFQEIDWTQPPPFVMSPRPIAPGNKHLAWITSPPSPASGGHQNLFRFIHAAENAGYTCSVYFWDWQGSRVDPERLRSMLATVSAYPPVRAGFFAYEGAVSPDADAIIATAWETAYASFLDPSTARRLYFVQDFEPWFYPAGPNAILAENTYRFGFHGLTAGAWLADRLAREYGMKTAHFDFAADTTTYTVTQRSERSGIFFYARPETPRRAYELGVRILELVHERAPHVPIHFAGNVRPDPSVRFPVIQHGAVDLSRLNAIYNECATALVLSLSNMSLLPLELIAAGVTPVVNDAPHNRMVSANRFIDYQPLVAQAMAQALVANASRNRTSADYDAMRASVSEFTWEDSGAQFVSGLEAALETQAR